MRRSLRWLLFIVLAASGVSLLNSSYGQPVGPIPMDPILETIVTLDEQARRETGKPLNLIRFAGRIGVRRGDEPIIIEPRKSDPSVWQQMEADHVEVIITLEGAESLSQLHNLGARIGSVIGTIVTAWVTPQQLSAIRQMAGVKHIAASHLVKLLQQPVRLQPQNDVSVPDTNATTLHSSNIRGQNVIVGIIDTGIDFCHKDFRTGSGSELQSRILFIWDQTVSTGSGNPPPGYTYGREWTKSQIEAALPSCPAASSISQVDSDGHGTHVAGSSAGDGSTLVGNTYRGMAPEADIIAVKCFPGCTDSHIIDGANYIFGKASSLGKPAVINLSLGGHWDPHDGTGALDRSLDALLGSGGRAIVAAAGNEGDMTIHAQATLNTGGLANITFNHPSGFFYQFYGTDVFDFWYPGAANFCVTIISPRGYTVGPVCAGAQKRWWVDSDANTPDGGVYLWNSVTGPYSFNGDREVVFWVDGPGYGAANDARAGTWTIRVNASSSSGRIDGWAVFGDNEFNPPYGNTDMTVGSPGTATKILTVGAYTTKRQWTDKCGRGWMTSETLQAIASFSSKGPTRDGRIKPDIAAPGTVIASVLSKDVTGTDCPSGSNSPLVLTSDNTYWIMAGTSMATPHTAGGVALLLQQNPNLSWSEIKSIVQSNARTDSFTGTTPNNTWGAGKLRVTVLAPPCPNTGAIFRIERTTGNVCADGSLNPNGADVVEFVRVSEVVEPGDVLELDPTKPGHYRKARGAYSHLVAGVVSTQPGVILGARGQSEGKVLLALIGRVPVKATAENGPIRPGDLLTSSSKPGYALRCDEARKCEGAIIGKALEALDGSDGVILMLVMK
uniref:Peptidase S8/S53 n=1 Tax=uncultured Acetothermia bacterium TaxID=236499 RepID=H5SH45_9BACT|nr:peptidase S8/S53 [uncultured Acetothermia bacterium]